jgi:threonine/homoserine/homoserine lactone efflux protein
MELFIVIAVTHFVALLSPGPDFFLILMTALNSGQRRARYTVFGIVVGNAFILALIFTLLELRQHVKYCTQIHMPSLTPMVSA